MTPDRETVLRLANDVWKSVIPISEADGDRLVRLTALLLEHYKPKPLTDDRIEDLRGEANRGFNIERDDYFKAFRDAEQAHGIK